MSTSHGTLNDLNVAYTEQPDPGTTKAIYIKPDGWNQMVPLVIGTTAETNTLPIPSWPNQRLKLVAKSVGSGGTRTVTLSTAATTLVFSAALQNVILEARSTATSGVYAWECVYSSPGVTGTALSRTTSSMVVDCTTSTLTVTEALHNNKIITLNRAAGIAVTLPTCAAGLNFTFIVGTTFTGAASIKSVTGADIMIGHATMGNNTDNSTVDWQALSSNTYDTIDLFGTANSTGGIQGQIVKIIGLAANLWFVEIQGDAAGTEATPFQDTVT